MKNRLLAVVLLAGCSVFGQVSIGITMGQPPPPRVIVIRPANPGPEYLWVDGYWYPAKNRYAWHDGYWTRPPYEGALWSGPRYDGRQFFDGYWSGGVRQQVRHDHGWDKDKKYRDYGRDHDPGNGKGKGRGKGKGH